MDKLPILEIQNLTKSFAGNQILKDLTFAVYPGEVIGYIGTNGAGKTTTVKIILGILTKDNGQVNVFGQEISPNDVSYKSRIGYVPESPDLYESLSVREYYQFLGGMYQVAPDEIDQKATRMLEVMGMAGTYHQRLSSFSKGMRQKVLIVASLLHNPDILFWDEPLSGLDANSVQIIKALMSELKKSGKTIFYSSHIMDTVEKVSDRIIILNDGRVAADAPFKQLKEESGHNLEQLFNQLTGVSNHLELAREIVACMEGGGNNEPVKNA